MPHRPILKSRPRLLDKRDAKRERDAIDRAENLKVKQRSGGRCEVIGVHHNAFSGRDEATRCPCRAVQIHHLISGLGRRNRGRSILAAHKLHVCAEDHRAIHGHVLRPVNATEREDATTVKYERVT